MHKYRMVIEFEVSDKLTLQEQTAVLHDAGAQLESLEDGTISEDHAVGHVDLKIDEVGDLLPPVRPPAEDDGC